MVQHPNQRPSSAKRPFTVIGELINNSFARAAKSWKARDLAGYQRLAKLQEELGAGFLTLNIDGTQSIHVTPQEMYDFIDDLIPAIQEATSVPISFDNPAIEFHHRCLRVYDPAKSGRPIVNSVAASRQHLDEMFELIAEYDTLAIGMASEKFTAEGAGQCMSADDVYGAASELTELLVKKANRTPDQIIIDPGLAPVGADTYGLVNMGLDAMRRIRANPNLAGVHLSVGLTNFSFGIPRQIRAQVESAYLTLAVDAGLDFVLANPEKHLELLPPDDRILRLVAEALDCGRKQDGESQEDAGFRQAAKIIELFDGME
jgi:5-methyltetrahydrofolate--homocysteine methyltransferase